MTNSSTDIFGTEIKIGDLLVFAGASAKLDVGIVEYISISSAGYLLGYRIVYIYQDRERKKFIRAGREVVCLPASFAARLQSSQACLERAFGSRLAYLGSKIVENPER